MIKVLLKLAVAALIANACWRVGTSYASYYRFEDAVEQTTQFGASRSEAELQSRIMELASEYDIPLAPEAFTVRRVGDHTFTDGHYTLPIDFAPGVTRPWTFTWHTDTMSLGAARPDSGAK